ncbi:hypothetical protein [Defluviimonas salinarum]|uniref:hypothetical protein n=1 Tax=Defluviimonas salinarum TaxID=2992147 RepID=UPI00223092B6|nr:hypothetical protein [Defluviimonas salinarum]
MAEKTKLSPIAPTEVQDAVLDNRQRCAVFFDAVVMQYELHRDGRVPGFKPGYETPFAFAWSDEIRNWVERNRAQEKADAQRLFQAYADSFGPITFPEAVSNRELYQSDKSYCLELVETDRDAAD